MVLIPAELGSNLHISLIAYCQLLQRLGWRIDQRVLEEKGTR